MAQQNIPYCFVLFHISFATQHWIKRYLFNISISLQGFSIFHININRGFWADTLGNGILPVCWLCERIIIQFLCIFTLKFIIRAVRVRHCAAECAESLQSFMNGLIFVKFCFGGWTMWKFWLQTLNNSIFFLLNSIEYTYLLIIFRLLCWTTCPQLVHYLAWWRINCTAIRFSVNSFWRTALTTHCHHSNLMYTNTCSTTRCGYKKRKDHRSHQHAAIQQQSLIHDFE